MTDRVIRVVVDSSGVARGAGRARRELGGLQRAGGGLASTFKAAGAAAAAFGIALGAREIIQAADAYQSLQNRLRIVTDSQEELNQVQQRLFQISQNTRTELEATTGLYSSAAIAAGELGASQEQLLRLTEISGKALAIQGSSAAEASGALRQLSQSFSSGSVRAEEFNSILEGAFPIAQAAARGIDEAGGSVGRLRQLVVDGEISSREFFDAIIAGGESIDEQFGETEVTLGQAITVLNNSFLSFVGRINEAAGATSGIAAVIVDLAGGIDDLADALLGTLEPTDELSDSLKIIATAGITVGAVFNSLANVIDATLGQALRSLLEIFGSVGEAFQAIISGDLARLPDIFADLGENLAEGFQESIETLGTETQEEITSAAERITEIWDATTRDIVESSKRANEETGRNPPVNPNSVETIDSINDSLDDYLDRLRITTGELQIIADAQGDSTEAVRVYREQIALAEAVNEAFKDSVPTAEIEALKQTFLAAANEQLQAQQALRAEIENEAIKQSFDEQIAALEEEILLLDADSEAIARNAEIRALAEGATAEQAARIRELTLELENSRDAQAGAADSLDQFFEDAKGSAEQTLSGLLADPLNADLDEVAFKFSQTLLQLAAEALSSEIFSLFSGGAGGGGLGGGAGGGGFNIGSLVGSFFGGGFQAGGQVRGGQPILVGERGPELFTPPGSGAIQPNININQAAQAAPTVMVNNITDPADVPAGLRTNEGQEEVINIIQRNPDAVKKILG